MTKSISILMEDVHMNIQEAQSTTKKVNSEKPTPKRITVKHSQAKGEENLENTREVTYHIQVSSIELPTDWGQR